MKKGNSGKIIAIIIAMIIVIAGAFVFKTNATVDCGTCEGRGVIRTIPCTDCESLEKGEICDTCGDSKIVVLNDSNITYDIAAETFSSLEEVACTDCEGSGKTAPNSIYYSTLMALFPPLLAIALALITKEVYSSLFIGILLGGLLSADWNPIGALDNLLNDGIIAAISETAGIFMFLVILGIFVALINKAGGSAAFGRWAKVHIKSRVGAMLATFVLGVLIFIDDYFNCLTVGSVMRPVTDNHKVSRAKLAYLIDATAAPVCMIAPVSSWAAAVAEFTEGTGYSGIELFIRAIPYNFYSLLTFVFIIAITLMKFDYGPMKLHESNAIKQGDLFTCGERVDSDDANEANPRGRVIDLVLPVLVLIIACIIGLVYDGGFFSGNSFVVAFSKTTAGTALPWGALIALVATVIYLMLRKIVTFKEAMECIPKGFIAMVPAILILTLAIALKNMTSILGATDYVGALMKSSAEGLANFLPAIIFVVACILSFSTGTSWGTFGILIPIVTKIFAATNPTLLIIGMSACLAGAVCGDHCSPISDTTIMSSAGACSDHLNHVSTQLPYAFTVAAISFVMYLIAAFVQNVFILLPLGAIITIATLFVIKKFTKNA